MIFYKETTIDAFNNLLNCFYIVSKHNLMGLIHFSRQKSVQLIFKKCLENIFLDFQLKFN